ELQRQKDCWQSRWEQATSAYQNSLKRIDPVDADRLHRVLSESLPTLKIQATLNGPLTESAASSHNTHSETLDETQGEPVVTGQTADDGKLQNVEPTPSDAIHSDPLAKDTDVVSATGTQNAPVEENATEEESDLLHWATETIGDG